MLLALAAWPAPAALLLRYMHAALICSGGIWMWCLHVASSTHATLGEVWGNMFYECSGSIAKVVHRLALPHQIA